ncbi:MAG: cbb3-type cytochrome c oxidase N-terminal domain-containing protein [Bacteroidota bacterium]
MKHSFKTIMMSMVAIALMFHTSIARAATESSSANTDFKLDVNTVLTACAFLLLIVLFVLGSTLRSTILFYHEKRKKESSDKSNGAKMMSLIIAGLILSSIPAMAQDAVVTTAGDGPSMIPESDVIRWVLYVVIALEVVVIFLFTKLIRFFTGIDAYNAQAGKPKTFLSIDFAAIWNKMNKFKSIEEEASIDTGHSYDGIRELNNVTPPWFIAGFLLSILFAIVYLYRYHVAESAPLQIEEYTIAVAEAKVKQAEYLKTQANNVDESSVVFLGADGIAAGQALFATNCVACHGDKGQGASVGPNLSDNYWLHKGSIQDIFKSIKYGWQEKGMKSWKDDFSPNQIAQLSSYIYSLKGSNPAGAKEPQGELFSESAAAKPIDSTTMKTAETDTTKK